jgi:hypothetical protein
LLASARWCPRREAQTSAAPRRQNRGDIDLLHPHHRFKGAPGFTTASLQRLDQHARRDLPRDAPFVLAPAARAFLPAIADDRIPIPIRLVLIVSRDLERKGFIVFERGTAVEAETGNAGNREFDSDDVTSLAGW